MLFAHKSEVTVGTLLEADAGFTCLKEGMQRYVYENKNGLYIVCADGRHYLDGQLDEGEVYIGLTKLQ